MICADLRRLVLLTGIAGIPLLFLTTENDPFNVPKLVLLMSVVGTAISLRAIEVTQGSRVALGPAWIPVLALIGPLLVGWLFSPYRAWALWGVYGRFQGLVPYLLTGVFALLVADGFRGQLVRVARALALSGALAGAYGLLQFVGIDYFEWAIQGNRTDYAISTLGNPNFTGGFLALCLPVSGALFLSSDQDRRFGGRCTILILLGLIVTFSQGGWAAALAGALFLLGSYWSRSRTWAYALGTASSLLVGVALLAAVTFSAVRPPDVISSSSIALRGAWWTAATRMALDQPLVGAGPNSFAIESSKYRTTQDALELGENIAEDPHSVFLSLVTASGVVGLVGFAVLFAWAFIHIKRTRETDLMFCGFSATLIAYGTQALVSIDELSLRTTGWAVVGALASASLPLSAKERRASSSRRRTRSEPIRKPWLLALAMLPALGSLIYSGLVLVADGRVRQGTLLFAEGKSEQAEREISSAFGYLSDVHYKSVLGAHLGSVQVDSSRTAALEKIHEVFSFTEDLPWVQTYTAYGRAISQLAGTDASILEDAVAPYTRAIELDPKNPVLRDELALIYRELEDFDATVDLLADYTEGLGQNQARLWGMLAEAYWKTGAEGKAREALVRAQELERTAQPVVDARILIEGD